MNELIQGTIARVFNESFWAKAKAGGGDRLSFVTRQKNPVVPAELINLLDLGEIKTAVDLLPLGLLPSEVDFPETRKIGLRHYF
jgi:hypothetical protein